MTESAFEPENHIQWGEWQPHEGSWIDNRLPNLPGLYRIRRRGRVDLDYIGQTGSGTMTLRKRQAMLKGIYAPVMPYRDPHTAGPALWALRHATNAKFEVSVAPIEGSTPWRKGMEAVAIALYRQEHGRSPTIEFGRMPAGYRMSSANNARLVAAGKRFRGGPHDESDQSHVPGIPPAGPFSGDPVALCWGGHVWSHWSAVMAATADISPGASGLYRLRRTHSPDLLYIGEGKIATRLMAHLSKIGDPHQRQGVIFADPTDVEMSWVVNHDWHKHHRLELENDLIAAYILATGRLPEAQFLG